jgi:xylulokinase
MAIDRRKGSPLYSHQAGEDPLILAFDLGTGGNKAALFGPQGELVAESFVSYPTLYPRPGWHEQRPEDWWEAVVLSVRRLLDYSKVKPGRIISIGISGHSLGVVPVDRSGKCLRGSTPIWSDSRAAEQASAFFTTFPEEDWYRLTGNGFPPPLYTLFKILWYRQHEPEIYARTACILGTKDYINFRLTDVPGTDFSYASGSGFYNLMDWKYDEKLLAASGLPVSLFPQLYPSSQVIGNLTNQAAQELGLPIGVKVVAGGVDNSCMALGARNLYERQVYNSQGSSSWIAVTSQTPLLDVRSRPFVFTHVIPGLFNSAIGVFSTGTSFRWVRDQFCLDLVDQARSMGESVYELMTALAENSPPGSKGVLFHPNMAGGSSLDESIHIRGAFLGLDLSHNRADLIRAAMEGIAMQERLALDVLRSLTDVSEEMIVVGGGSRSRLWRQIHADMYNLKIVKTSIDQSAAALGAAALAAVGTGLWDGYDMINNLHQVEEIASPQPDNVCVYERLLPVFKKTGKYLAELGIYINQPIQEAK